MKDLSNPLVFGKRLIEAELIMNPKSDEQRYAHSGSESKDINEREACGSCQVSPSDDKVISKHKRDL